MSDLGRDKPQLDPLPVYLNPCVSRLGHHHRYICITGSLFYFLGQGPDPLVKSVTEKVASIGSLMSIVAVNPSQHQNQHLDELACKLNN